MKKLWISIKRGLIRDPKHRVAMGECVWLFQYMIDVADWDTGKIFGWKDEAAADDMQMPIRTLREQRRKLESLDYIVCTQKQYDQEIAITNWTNPREYSGEVYNPKQGDSKAEPSEDSQGDTQGYIQGDTQGSTPDVTPTFNPNNQIPNGEDFSFPEPTPTKKKGDVFDGMVFYAQQAQEHGIDKVEDLLTRLEKGIGVNIPRSVANQSVAKRLLKEEAEGRTVDQFLTWLRSDEWRMSHLYIYADPEKIWTIWPQAFAAPTTKPIEYFTPPKDDGEYISKEEAKRRGLAK